MNDQAKDKLKEFRKINTDGTISLARAAAEAGVKRFVFLSSIKVNGEETAPDQPFDEDSPPSPVDFYGVSKHEAELKLRAFAELSPLEVSIIRPTLVYGEGVKGNVHRLRRLMENGIPLPLASVSRNKRSMIHLDNLISLIITCAEHPEAAGKTFMASDNHDMSTTEFVDFLAKLDGRSGNQIRFPVWLLVVLGRMLGREADIKRLTGTLQVDIGHTMRTLNWEPPRQIGLGCTESAAK